MANKKSIELVEAKLKIANVKIASQKLRINELEEHIKQLESGEFLKELFILKKENLEMKLKMQPLLAKRALNDVMLAFHEAIYTAAAADYLINPNPIPIHATKAGKGQDFKVGLMNILLIKSNSRSKMIYLKEAIIPVEGGLPQYKIETNDQELNFDKLLAKLQRSGHHLLKANRSEAISIYHYNLSERKTFVLNSLAPDGFPAALKNIKTDKTFDSDLYHERLMEINRLTKNHKDVSTNIKKIEEINRYINKQDVTK